MSQKEPEGPQPEVGDGPFPGGPSKDPEEPPGENPDRLEPALEPCSSRFLASVAAGVEGLRQRVQQLISRINEGREDDHNALSSFRSSLLLQPGGDCPQALAQMAALARQLQPPLTPRSVATAATRAQLALAGPRRERCQGRVSVLAEQLEERLFHLYERHNEHIQQGLQELAELMERLDQAQGELRQVCCTVEEACRDLCMQNEV